MAIKQALIVDDSKSARAVLKRMLKELDLDVDTVESAADAIGYLEGHHPDVIFMDHMMPGMDGFEAVKQIKKNPQTAVIPIMMYTSKGGDVYLSQARALGAVGIISKTISPVGLKESLFKLGLVADRRIESSLVTDKPIAGETSTPTIEQGLLNRQNEYDININDLRRLMDDQTIELHKSMWLGIESVSNEIFNRLNSEREELLEKILLASAEKNKVPWPIYIVGSLLLLSMFFNISLFFDAYQLEKQLAITEKKQRFFQQQEIDRFANENNRTTIAENMITEEEKITEEIMHDKQQARMEFIKWAQDKVIEYPYNELALNDNRLYNIEELVKKAEESGYTGSIILQTHVGRFCLSRDENGKHELADGTLPVTHCEYMGNHVQPDDAPSTHQSLSFANYLSDISSLNEKGIFIEVASVPRKIEISKYPEQIPQTLINDWNQAAQLNNRIIFKLSPHLPNK